MNNKNLSQCINKPVNEWNNGNYVSNKTYRLNNKAFFSATCMQSFNHFVNKCMQKIFFSSNITKDLLELLGKALCKNAWFSKYVWTI